MCDIIVLEGIIPSSIVYGYEDDSDVEYKLEKYKEDGNNIYYRCWMKEWYSREFEFIFNK